MMLAQNSRGMNFFSKWQLWGNLCQRAWVKFFQVFPTSERGVRGEYHTQDDHKKMCGESAHLGYVSPEVILPLPKATERKNRIVKKKVKNRIMTDTQEKDKERKSR